MYDELSAENRVGCTKRGAMDWSRYRSIFIVSLSANYFCQIANLTYVTWSLIFHHHSIFSAIRPCIKSNFEVQYNLDEDWDQNYSMVFHKCHHKKTADQI